VIRVSSLSSLSGIGVNSRSVRMLYLGGGRVHVSWCCSSWDLVSARVSFIR
jgi:hypothetical protein